MPAAHCVSSLAGIILHADQSFLDMLQRSQSELIGASYKTITDPKDLRRSAQMLAALKEGAAPVRLQKRYLRPDGTSIPANLLVTRFSNPDRLISTLFWHDDGRPLPPAELWEAALRVAHIHDARVTLFGPDLSSDPVGTIVIGTYLAEAEGRNIALGEIATYAAIAPSTARRWLKVLQQRGIIETTTDAELSILLTQAGIDKVEAMLAAVYTLPGGARRIA